jgi:hypothetical protein
VTEEMRRIWSWIFITEMLNGANCQADSLQIDLLVGPLTEKDREQLSTRVTIAACPKS